MEATLSQYPPGDPKMIDTIVHQLKSQGIFDQFRKECIADVDTKPAYQNLHQRVEGTVSGFLANQVWRPDMNKNSLRDSLRKHIHESGFLDMGVERIVDQVVNPKVLTVFVPQVEDVVYNFLGIEKPEKRIDTQYSKPPSFNFNLDHSEVKKEIRLTDLLPEDLDSISPESDNTKKADNSAEEGELNDDDQSPPFKPINENSVGSISGISGLTSPDSRHSPISFNGIVKDRPVTPCMSPVGNITDEQITKNISSNLLTHGGETHDSKQREQNNETNENKVVRLPNEEVKKTFVLAVPKSSDEGDEDSSSSSSRPSSSVSDSTSSSSSSSSDSTDSPEPEPLEEKPLLQLPQEILMKKNTPITGTVKIEEKPIKIEEKTVKIEENPVKIEEKPVKIEEKPVKIEEKSVKRDKQEASNKDEKAKKLPLPVVKDKKEEKYEKVDVKREKDERSVKKPEQVNQHIKKEEKVIKKTDKEQKPIRKDEKPAKKLTKEVPSSRFLETEEKLFSTFDQGETTLKRITKDGKMIRVEKEEKPVKKDNREEKSMRHLEKESQYVKEEKPSKPLSKDPKEGKLVKSDKVDKSLHRNEEPKLSSKEDVKKDLKKDVKEDKSAKKRTDDKIEKLVKKDDKSSRSFEKDIKLIKKEGKHDGTHLDYKPVESRNHSLKTPEGSHHSHKSHKSTEKDRVKPSDRHVSKEDKSKVEDKSKHEKDEKSKLEDKSKYHDKARHADKSKSGDKIRHDDKHNLKNGSGDKDRLMKQDTVHKNSYLKEKSHKSHGDKLEVKEDSKSKLSSKHKDSKKEKPKLTDDHGRHRDRRFDDRGSTDRDSNGTRDRSSSSSRTYASTSRDSGHREKKSSGSSGKTSKGGNNDASENTRDSSADTDAASGDDAGSLVNKKPKVEGDPAAPSVEKGEYICVNNEGKLLLKIKKPKIAANIFEVRKIIQQRRSLAKLEKRRQREFERARGLHYPGEAATTSTMKRELPSSPKAPEPSKTQEALHTGLPESIQTDSQILPLIQPAPTTPEVKQPTETSQTSQTPRSVQVVKSDIVPSPDVPQVPKPVVPSSPDEKKQPSETPSQSLEADSQNPTVGEKPTKDRAPIVLPPVKIMPLVEAQTSTEPPIKGPDYSASEADDDEPELKYFEVPEINEYDNHFLIFMKGLDESETLSDIEVSSVNTDDLDDLSDSDDSLFSSPENIKEVHDTKCGGTTAQKLHAPVDSIKSPLDSKAKCTSPVASASKLPGRKNAGRCTPPMTPKLTENARVSSAQKSSGLSKVVNKGVPKAPAPMPGALFNGGVEADPTAPVSIRSKPEYLKRLDENVSSVPTIRPQLPEDIENASFPPKSPIPVGALSRHKRGIGNFRRMPGRPRVKTELVAGEIKTRSSGTARPSRVSYGKRGVKRLLQSSVRSPEKDKTESEAKTFLPSPLKKKDDSNKKSESLSESEILDIVVGNDPGEYGVHTINNNVESLYEGGRETGDTHLDLHSNEVKDATENPAAVLQTEHLIPTPDSRTSGSSSSGSVETLAEKRRKLGPCRRLGLSRLKHGKRQPLAKEEVRITTSQTADFVMPLSPESDVSASSGDQAKKLSGDAALPKCEDMMPASHDISLRQGSAVETPASRGQRYSSDDLYKPRPLFSQLPRRTRAALSAPQGQVPVSGPAAKRRAVSLTSPAATPLPKTKR